MKRLPLKNAIFFWHNNSLRYLPAVTAAITRRVLARTAPEKILSIDMFGPAARARRASCVLSPNSAINVVVNESLMIALAERIPWSFVVQSELSSS